MRWLRRRDAPATHPRLLTLDDVLAALGDDGVDGRRRAEVPLTDLVGTVSRPDDFDGEFRLVNPSLRDRWAGLADALAAGAALPPVSLIQLGDLYFVNDGHHRVSAARSLGRDSVVADVLRVCTVAYALCCLRSAAHLHTKAAERRFLERVPLPVETRCGLWLDRAESWLDLADAVEQWGRRTFPPTGRHLTPCALAAAWWTEEVVPAVTAARHNGNGAGLRDIQVYVETRAAEVAPRR